MRREQVQQLLALGCVTDQRSTCVGHEPHGAVKRGLSLGSRDSREFGKINNPFREAENHHTMLRWGIRWTGRNGHG